jgi:hypothetical protein
MGQGPGQRAAQAQMREQQAERGPSTAMLQLDSIDAMELCRAIVASTAVSHGPGLTTDHHGTDGAAATSIYSSTVEVAPGGGASGNAVGVGRHESEVGTAPLSCEAVVGTGAAMCRPSVQPGLCLGVMCM